MTGLTQTAADAADPAFAAVVPTWEELAKVGFESLSSYQNWCRLSGVDDGLDREQPANWLEGHLAEALQPKRPLAEKRRQTLELLAAGELPWKGFVAEWLGEDAEVHKAFRRLILHVDGFINVIAAKSIYRSSHYRHLTHCLLALAHHHRRWIRPLEEWRCVSPKDGHPRRSDQVFSLACYLLARYPVPNAMVAAWFGGVEEQGLRQQEWFMHMASGGSIRDLDAPIKLTRRMAHLFQRSPQLGNIEKGMRWAQVISMGGNGILTQAILKTRLGRNFENDEFWSSVVLFLVNNAMMDPTWVGPIVDYVHNMKFASRRIVQEGGGLEEAPPPQPNLTMKGRSATKLLRQVEAWHGHLSREEYVNFQSWQPCGMRSWEWEDETDELGKVRWTVQELLSSWELAAEGRAMHHCVVLYSDQCADGNTAIWSIGALQEGVEEREHVLTVALDIKSRTVTQARGRYNAVPNKPPKAGKVRSEVQGGYLRLLDRSEHVMQEWMQRERLRRDD
ncbi:MAG: PcfJ domain-containing protein [Gemmatimonadota bacterium]|nr:PcfJ domain-containing protein [Gemmatimonadota bacterium]